MSELSKALDGMKSGLFDISTAAAIDQVLSENQADIERPSPAFVKFDEAKFREATRDNVGLDLIDGIADRFDTHEVSQMLQEKYDGISAETIKGMMLGALVVQNALGLYIYAEKDMASE